MKIKNNIGKSILHTTIMLVALLLPAGAWAQVSITSLGAITSASGTYVITQDIDASGFSPSIATFSGTLEAAINPATHMPYRISGLTVPLFETLTGTVRNLVLDEVAISGHSGNTGAIACTANSTARIYNVGILSGSVGGTANTGGLVGTSTAPHASSTATASPPSPAAQTSAASWATTMPPPPPPASTPW